MTTTIAPKPPTKVCSYCGTRNLEFWRKLCPQCGDKRLKEDKSAMKGDKYGYGPDKEETDGGGNDGFDGGYF